MKKIGQLILVITYFLNLHVQGYGQFTLSAEIRPRLEYRHGFQSLSLPDDDPAFFTSQRSRLNLLFSESNLTLGISLQDVRVWGDVPQQNRSDNSYSVHEAWAELKLREGFFVKFGRQHLVYDDSRILGNGDWNQQGRSHDLALLRIAGQGGLQFHAGFAFNQPHERNAGTSYTLSGNYKTMQFLWLNKKSGQSQFSLLFLNNGLEDDAERNFFTQTLGGRYAVTGSGRGVEGSAYLQTGKLVSGKKLGAWYLAASGFIRPSEQVRLDAGFELLSGTNQADQAEQRSRSFAPLYGTNHKFNGHMDYFYVGNHLNNVGLVDMYGTVEYAMNRFSAGVTPHLFFSHASLSDPADPTKNMPGYLGVELDFFGGYKINEFSLLRFGYSKMFGSESMEVLKGGNRKEPNHWAWLMIIVRPVLFKTIANQ